MTMAGIEEIDEAEDGSTYIKPKETKQFLPEDWLYVFVAPLPLAAKWQEECDLAVLGPTFATDTDVTVHVRSDQARRFCARSDSGDRY